jgi:MFS family permease
MVGIFLSFAFAYFLSALIRAITATLSPTFTQELNLQASDLGLLAGGYFLGFAATQLPLGQWLDRYGPKRVILCFLAVAVVGCAAFALATSFVGLLAARVLCGAGVSACLMAPLTGYRRWFAPEAQMRATAWMLMSGSLGMLASTLPVQWLLPVMGWRPLFWLMALGVLIAMAGIAWRVPAWAQTGDQSASDLPVVAPGYTEVWRHPYFRRIVPLGFFNYGGMVAMQTLWAGPWMARVCGYTALESATGLFWINVTMLCVFWAWGMLGTWLARRHLSADLLMTWGMPASMAALAMVIAVESDAGIAAPALWALFCALSSVVSLSQPALALAFPQALAGRALSAYNLAIFAGVFAVQWGVGLAVDAFRAQGMGEVVAFQAAMGVFLLCCLGSYGWFLRLPKL